MLIIKCSKWQKIGKNVEFAGQLMTKYLSDQKQIVHNESKQHGLQRLPYVCHFLLLLKKESAFFSVDIVWMQYITQISSSMASFTTVLMLVGFPVNQNNQLTIFHHHLQNNVILNWTVFHKCSHFLTAVQFNITSFCQKFVIIDGNWVSEFSQSNPLIINENWRKFTV